MAPRKSSSRKPARKAVKISAKRSIKRLVKKARMVTAKNLPEKSYQAIHSLPHGTRQKTLHALIGLAITAKARFGDDWHEKLLRGRIFLR